MKNWVFVRFSPSLLGGIRWSIHSVTYARVNFRKQIWLDFLPDVCRWLWKESKQASLDAFFGTKRRRLDSEDIAATPTADVADKSNVEDRQQRQTASGAEPTAVTDIIYMPACATCSVSYVWCWNVFRFRCAADEDASDQATLLIVSIDG